ncbi:hypothetical protein PN485_03990 [Nodularia spumigena CS-588/05]|uniref:hypothetical protein n=1 Tax=Nodularia spumigena TaxID=70799 RepID=UPI0023308ED1|nr:hypothetical protein [Nodularia spumigena]MDB9351175.1 hypothetical protein [Nodularia spumigena CS-588/05]
MPCGDYIPILPESRPKRTGLVSDYFRSVQLQLPDNDDTLYLVGIGSLWANPDDPEQALSNVPEAHSNNQKKWV